MAYDAGQVHLYDRGTWAQDLADLGQQWLLDESALISFARDRGIPVHGVVKGDPGMFFRKGWLGEDGIDDQGAPRFHPFRVYPLKRILDICNLHVAPSASLRRSDAVEFFRDMLLAVPSDTSVGAEARESGEIADLAILLEPLYWPYIAGVRQIAASVPNALVEDRFDDYRRRVLAFLRGLDAARWRNIHERLRREAASLDDNPELYVLLRASTWEHRKTLTGTLSGSLWIRHIGEIIRRGFEEAFGEQWPEEFISHGQWFSHALELSFGSTRPLDDILQTQPYVLHGFGLSAGSKVRWYVEGETEYHVVCEFLGRPARYGIELVNLRGVIAADRDNIALKLGDWLKEDQQHHRFSILSLDCDVPANLKVVRHHVKQGNIVGYVAAQKPDFEFANFTAPELLELAIQRAAAQRVPTVTFECVDLTRITGIRPIEDLYRSASGRSLKDAEWGKVLATLASTTPLRPDTGEERPILRTLGIALRCRTAHYDLEKEYFGFDPTTFERIRIKQNPPHIIGP